MLTAGNMFASTPETEEIFRRTPAKVVMEYFGLQKEDLAKPKKLKEMGVKHTARLAELGVSKEKFEEIFADVLDFDEPANEPTRTSEDAGAVERTGNRAPRTKKQ